MNYALLEEAIKNSKLTVDEIAEKVGISKPTVYNSFKTGKVAIGIIEKICLTIGFDMSKLFTEAESNLLNDPHAEYGSKKSLVEISYQAGDKIVIDDLSKKIVIYKK